METATLTGTEKQVAWAEKIRGEFISWQTSLLARSEKDLAREINRGDKADPEDLAYAQECANNDRTALDAAHRQTSATFWIETRGQTKTTVASALIGKGKITNLGGVAIQPKF